MITLSTGRMYQSARAIAAEIGLNVPLITYNGALIQCSQSEDLISQEMIDANTGRELIALLDQGEMHYHVYVDGALYVPRMTEKSRHYAERSGVAVHHLHDLDLHTCAGFYKLLIMGDPEDLDRILIEMEDSLDERIRAFKSHPSYLEVVQANVSKGNALRKLAEMYSISCERIMAIGDQFNDMDMISFAGLGVAMGNAPDEVKSCAIFITETNDQEGAAKAIERWAL